MLVCVNTQHIVGTHWKTTVPFAEMCQGAQAPMCSKDDFILAPKHSGRQVHGLLARGAQAETEAPGGMRFAQGRRQEGEKPG